MLNSISNIYVSTPQTTFKAKGTNRHELHAFIDAMSDACAERSLAEKTETAKRKSISLLAQKIRCSHVGKIVERANTAIEHITEFFKHFNERDDEYAKWIIGEVKAGRIDSDHAMTLLANHGILDTFAEKVLMQIHKLN